MSRYNAIMKHGFKLLNQNYDLLCFCNILVTNQWSVLKSLFSSTVYNAAPYSKECSKVLYSDRYSMIDLVADGTYNYISCRHEEFIFQAHTLPSITEHG